MRNVRHLPLGGPAARGLDPAALEELRHARSLLETPGIAAQLANAVGAPLEYVVTRRLPKAATRLVNALAATYGPLFGRELDPLQEIVVTDGYGTNTGAAEAVARTVSGSL